ncbi:hypothetical protein [Gloeocapsopsis dulcis]|uniref:Uncharacterized protein n=1 Tax=Gloeocapsopsis dulcis AAB1 = 1H9 TaxID=1433147 RepID=A0A6N8FTP2_9CHRO|nr:hypothetical protein [Gloeocapsopsis dulcis]MUL36478.1 hypothetical protein [Gloeocapsopsis dulcis AAB1 = 1H9]WNN87766.1 hypothetical protein P0S91_15755 [Gloeocapsopsis dulcis]
MARRKKHIQIAAIPLAIAVLAISTVPSVAATITTSYRNSFRVCTARLLSVGITDVAAANACAAALNPRTLSSCVVSIEQRTEIAAGDALATCRQVRRPDELATCVVGISQTSQEQPANVLDYCGRSLLPVRFAECVVGLRSEINFTPVQAMDSCIDASDPLGNLSPTFVPAIQTPGIQTSPVPITPVPPEAQPIPALTEPVTP